MCHDLKKKSRFLRVGGAQTTGFLIIIVQV